MSVCVPVRVCAAVMCGSLLRYDQEVSWGEEREGGRRGKRGRETMRREGEEEGVEEREGGSTAKKLKIIREKLGVKKEKD